MNARYVLQSLTIKGTGHLFYNAIIISAHILWKTSELTIKSNVLIAEIKVFTLAKQEYQ